MAKRQQIDAYYLMTIDNVFAIFYDIKLEQRIVVWGRKNQKMLSAKKDDGVMMDKIATQVGNKKLKGYREVGGRGPNPSADENKVIENIQEVLKDRFPMVYAKLVINTPVSKKTQVQTSCGYYNRHSNTCSNTNVTPTAIGEINCEDCKYFAFPKDIKAKETLAKIRAQIKEEMIAICVNSDGIDYFEEGIEYMVKRQFNDTGMLLVENMMGDDVKVMKERFQLIKD